MPIAPELIASLAGKLISKWSADSEVNDDRIPVKEELIRGLNQLISFGDLVIPEGDQDRRTANNDLIALAISAIRTFQTEFAPNLDADGFLGNQTLNELFKIIRCLDGKVGESDGNPVGATAFTPSSSLRPRVEIWIYIDAETLPRVTDHTNNERDPASNIFEIQLAAMEWSRICNIRFQFPDKSQKNKAHVWVVGESLSEPGLLALADLWPRNGVLSSRLMLRFNTNRAFVSSFEFGSPVFFGTAVHEFGHILGLSHQYKETDGHTAPRGEMMHPAHQPTLIEVPEADKLRIQRIWGKPS